MQYNYKEFKKLFEEDTNKALEYFFEHKKDYSGSIFVWTSCIGKMIKDTEVIKQYQKKC